MNQIEYQTISLHSKLTYCQRQIYILLRVNLAEYMNVSTKNIFEAHMETETNHHIEGGNLNDNTLFDVDKRYH